MHNRDIETSNGPAPMPPLSLTEKTIAVFAVLLPSLSFLAILICCIKLGAF